MAENWNTIDINNLPKQGRELLFTTNYGDVYAGHWVDIVRDEPEPTETERLEDIIDGFRPLFYETNSKAIAWMYFPDPYEPNK